MSIFSSISKGLKRAWKTPIGRAAMIVVGGAVLGPAVSKAGGELGGTFGSLVKTVGDAMAAPAAAIGKGLSSIGLDAAGGAITDFTGELGNASEGWLGDLTKPSAGGELYGPPDSAARGLIDQAAQPRIEPGQPVAGAGQKYDDLGNVIPEGQASAPAPASATSGSAAGDTANEQVRKFIEQNPVAAKDAAAKGGQQGLIASALDWVRKNPAALVVGGQMAMGYAQGKAQQDMLNDQRSYDEKQAADARARFQSNMNVSGVKIPGLVGQAINK